MTKKKRVNRRGGLKLKTKIRRVSVWNNDQ